MKLRELKRQNDLAGQLQSKLERIAKLYSALPNGDGLLVMVKHASDLEERLARAKEAYCDPAFPTADELKPTVEAAAAIARNLQEASEAEVDIPV
jgi:lysophospholipase L1-like esterase